MALLMAYAAGPETPSSRRAARMTEGPEGRGPEARFRRAAEMRLDAGFSGRSTVGLQTSCMPESASSTSADTAGQRKAQLRVSVALPKIQSVLEWDHNHDIVADVHKCLGVADCGSAGKAG